MNQPPVSTTPASSGADKLLKTFHNSDYPYAFGSRKTVYKFFPHLTKKQVDTALLKSSISTKFKKYKKPRQFLPIYGEILI